MSNNSSLSSKAHSSAHASRWFWSMASAGAILLGTTSAQAAIPIPQILQPLIAQLVQPKPAIEYLPVLVSFQVKRDLSQRFDIPRRSLTIVSHSRETWGDSCLGLAQDNERCAMALVEGWRVEVTNGQQNWVYRTDLRAQVIKLETPDRANLPPQVVDRLFETIAKELRVPASSLKVMETQPATWDGCMGLYAPDQACTKIAISGWRVIVAGDQQTWVYHVSGDASRIVQNPTASVSSQGELIVSFIPPENQDYGRQTATQVFREIESGGLNGVVSEKILMSDGVIYKRAWRPNVPQTSDPVIEKRLSPQQVQQFFQVLQQQRFPNLNGMRYITSAAFADYPTKTLLAMGNAVEYIDLEKDNLPPSLQAVIQAWERL